MLNPHQIYDWMLTREQELSTARGMADSLTTELKSALNQKAFLRNQLQEIEWLCAKMEWDSTIDISTVFCKIRDIAQDR
jgi:hypothetical protein